MTWDWLNTSVRHLCVCCRSWQPPATPPQAASDLLQPALSAQLGLYGHSKLHHKHLCLLQKLAATCNSTTGCTGFTYDLLSALSGGPYGILKFGTVQPQCLTAVPTSAFYAKAAASTAVTKAPAAGASQGHLGAILGGET